MRPRIGILRAADELDARYAAALVEAGAAPVPLELAAGLSGLDGLLVPGGGDFAPPQGYREGVRFELVPELRLGRDQERLGEALERGLPILGICYGMQLLARLAGGRFVYDIASELPAAGSHRLPEPAGRHGIEITPGSRLAALLGTISFDVNSAHHQAVATTGSGLRVAARATDGVIEAIESDASDGFVLGVQWHPERMERAHRERLFAAFVRHARP